MTAPTVAGRQDALALLERGRRLIAEARTAGEVKQLRDQAAAVERYLRQQRVALDAVLDAGELKLRAERRLGDLLRETARPGNPQLSHDATNGRLPPGVTRSQSSRWQRVAAVPAEVFEAEVASARRRREGMTTAAVLRLAGRVVERRRHESARRRMAAAARPTDLVRVGDFREGLADLPGGGVALVLADPPYGAKSRHLYGDVARLAGRVLRPGGSLVAYAPTYAVADALALMTPHLGYWGLIAVRHAGTWPHLNIYRVIAGCKALLWMVKGRYTGGWVVNLIHGEAPDKAAHEWTQGAAEAAYCVEKMSGPGDLVLDPMCGSGTALLAALRLGRRALGCEIDRRRAKVAAAALAEVTPEGGPR